MLDRFIWHHRHGKPAVVDHWRRAVAARLGAIQWLVLCGAALVLAIALGTAYFAVQFRAARARGRRARTQQHGAVAVAAFRPAARATSSMSTTTSSAICRRRGRLRRRIRTEHVDVRRARNAARQARGAAACRQSESLQCRGTADQLFRDLAGARRHIADRRYFKEFTSGKPTPDVIVEPVDEQGNGKLDHDLRAQDRQPPRRDRRFRQPGVGPRISRILSRRWRWAATPEFR